MEADGPECTTRFGVYSAYSDAVGDLGLVNAEWGPSIGLFQIRSLRDPSSGNLADTLRVASKLEDPVYNAHAAFVISKQGTDWTPWSTFKNGAYLPHKGKDFEIKTGHVDAGRWNA